MPHFIPILVAKSFLLPCFFSAFIFNLRFSTLLLPYFELALVVIEFVFFLLFYLILVSVIIYLLSCLIFTSIFYLKSSTILSFCYIFAFVFYLKSLIFFLLCLLPASRYAALLSLYCISALDITYSGFPALLLLHSMLSLTFSYIRSLFLTIFE